MSRRRPPDLRIAADMDLVVACLPPVLNRDVALAPAAAGKRIVCEH